MRVSVLLIIIFISTDTFGQLWLTKEFWETTDSTTAFCKRVVNSYNSDNTINVTDFLITGEKYFEGSVVYINGGLPVNNYMYYYKSGKLKFEGNQTVLKPSGFEILQQKNIIQTDNLDPSTRGLRVNWHI